MHGENPRVTLLTGCVVAAVDDQLNELSRLRAIGDRGGENVIYGKHDDIDND